MRLERQAQPCCRPSRSLSALGTPTVQGGPILVIDIQQRCTAATIRSCPRSQPDARYRHAMTHRHANGTVILTAACRTSPIDSSSMDYRWAEGLLGEYVQAVRDCGTLQVLTKERRAAVKALNQRLPQINYILASLTPDQQFVSGSNLNWHEGNIPVIRRALGLLEGARAMRGAAEQLSGPVLPISLLDPVVFQAAIGHWTAGHYRNAVGDAAIAVNQFMQRRVGRTDISDRELMSHAFSEDEPKPTQKRLRCPGNPKSESVRSQQQGAKLFAMGCYAALRNPANHLSGDWNPVTAFQHLAAFSIVASWARDWRVEHYVAPIPDLTTRLAPMQKIE
jgi:Protein of unknown function (Hypoth_ymh)